MNSSRPFHLAILTIVGLLAGGCDSQSQKTPSPPQPPGSTASAIEPRREDPGPQRTDSDKSAGIEPTIRSVISDTPGEFSITYEWIVERVMREDWRVYVHFTDTTGRILFQNDHDPVPPTSQWTPGRLLQGPRRVKIPTGLDGTVQIRMGLYAPDQGGAGSSGRAGLDGRADQEKRIHVGSLDVREGTVIHRPLD
jgi:hypothetical protein